MLAIFAKNTPHHKIYYRKAIYEEIAAEWMYAGNTLQCRLKWKM